MIPIPSMPGMSRHTLDSMVKEVGRGMALGVKSFILFPKVFSRRGYWWVPSMNPRRASNGQT